MTLIEIRKYAEENNDANLTPEELDHVSMCVVS